MLELTARDFELTEKVIQKAYVQAANSFAMIARNPIAIKNTEIKVSNKHDFEKLSKMIRDTEKNTLVETKIIGELSGTSYLLLSERECDQIYRSCIAGDYSRGKSPDLEKAIIMEIDNIISAAVITEFSNILQKKIYGDVPIYFQDKPDEIITKLISEIDTIQEGKDYFIFTNTHFYFSEFDDLTPIFFWQLDEAFIQAFKGIESDKIDVK